MIWIKVFFSLSENLELIRQVTSLLSPSENMQFCNEQIRTQPLFSPPCASATYDVARMCRRKNCCRRNYMISHKKQPRPGRALTIWRLLHMLRHFDPLFSGLWIICIVSTPIFLQKCCISTPIFHKNWAKCIVSPPLFLTLVAFRVDRRCWASLSPGHWLTLVSFSSSLHWLCNYITG